MSDKTKALPDETQVKSWIGEVMKEAKAVLGKELADQHDALEERWRKAFEAHRDREEKGITKEDLNDLLSNEQRIQKQTKELAKMVWCVGHADRHKTSVEAAAKKLSVDYGDKHFTKAIETTTDTGGGIAIAPAQGEFISSLFANTAVRKLGARQVPLPTGTITLPASNAGATAYNVAEGSAGTVSSPNMRGETLRARKIMVHVVVNNEYLDFATPESINWIDEEMVMAATIQEETDIIRGSGDGEKIRGLRYRVISGNGFTNTKSGSDATATEIYTDLMKMQYKVGAYNIPMDKPGYLFSKREETKIKSLLNSLVIPLFAAEMSRGTLLGAAFDSTTIIPVNLSVTGSGDETENYFADWNQVLLGIGRDPRVEVYRGGAYVSGGSVVSGVMNDQTVMAVSMMTDAGVRHQGKELSVITDSDWGSAFSS